MSTMMTLVSAVLGFPKTKGNKLTAEPKSCQTKKPAPYPSPSSSSVFNVGHLCYVAMLTCHSLWKSWWTCIHYIVFPHFWLALVLHLGLGYVLLLWLKHWLSKNQLRLCIKSILVLLLLLHYELVKCSIWFY